MYHTKKIGAVESEQLFAEEQGGFQRGEGAEIRF